MNKLSLIIASVVCLSACSEDGSSSPDTTLATSYTRVTTDQPDPTQYENTVHIVYAVPSGNEDKERDKSYQLQKSIIAADKWFYGISGKQLRLDLQDNGDVDITYWPMTETNAELHQYQWGMRDKIVDKLKQTDWYNPDKLYVIYFEGSHYLACGDKATNGGHVIELYLQDPEPNAGYVCSTDSFTANEHVNGFNEYLLIHKVIRVLGVNEEPTDTNTGNDVMSYPHSIVGELWAPEFVDFNNDDYFMHSDTNKVDILYSAFLLPNDGSELPPNWRDND
ncbi:hypothetical protein [Psychromonas sp. Urea-02u-13]|uniref:hypothetical protein n=1 Tax=Psychromonas sp. Urea-02u-13 TaxID=2058326 RepID=UPI000C32F36C|nr:hypothetical protein [Psychromonas sp. Urea-02u-13]PKG38861.1 hypothetical protein CXF74_11260 [Psychromonas sp. Urea-02u-13]